MDGITTEIQENKSLSWKQRLMRRKWLLLTVACLFIICATAGVWVWRCALQKAQLLEKRKENWLALKRDLAQEVSGFSGQAGIVVKDLSTNWELSLNKEKQFPAASLVKLPVMLAIFEAAQEGTINLDDKITLRGVDKAGGSGVLKSMPNGSVYTVEELIELMIDSSDNTAANILIGMLDFEYLNRWFQEFGLKETTLVRKMMDFRYRTKGIENYTSPGDMTYTLEKIYRQGFLSSALSERCLELLKGQKVNDRIPAYLPPGTVVAHKTGLEREVCHDAGIVFTPNGDLLICVLTRNSPSRKAAKQFIATVASRVYDYSQ